MADLPLFNFYGSQRTDFFGISSLFTSILWKPKDILLVAGFPEAHKAKRLTRKAIKSEARCAASVCRAKLLANTPPGKHKEGSKGNEI